MPRALFIYGTRPEAIKMAPLIQRMKAEPDFEAVVAVTGQHRQILEQVHSVFSVEPDHDLGVFHPGQSLSSMSEVILNRVSSLISQVRPDTVIVQGDTTSAAISGLACFYQQIPVVHVEAGLRTGNPSNPFPEEMNRALLGRLSSLHLAPTLAARANLEREGIASASIVVTGNTVIDALQAVIARAPGIRNADLARLLQSAGSREIVTVTTHRRESWGQPMDRVFSAVDALAASHPNYAFVLPLHPNPLVQGAADRALSTRANIHRLDPLQYTDFCTLMSRSRLILSDSGGVQEEAPALGVPVLVLRDTTERPEAVASGWAILVGTDCHQIVATGSEILRESEGLLPPTERSFVFGDGTASERSIAAVRSMFEPVQKPEDFRGSVMRNGAAERTGCGWL